MIRSTRTAPLWIATLDRPDKANSLTGAMLSELADIAEAAGEARVLILTGEGKVFSAGADLDEARAGPRHRPGLGASVSGASSRRPA
jgi:enoyl-CoA hydratase